MFSFRIDQTAPLRPAQNLPASQAVIANIHTPTFTWGLRPYYIWQVDDDANFGSPHYTVTLPVALTLAHKLPAAKALPNGLYYWRVRACDVVGNLSPWIAHPFTIAVP